MGPNNIRYQQNSLDMNQSMSGPNHYDLDYNKNYHERMYKIHEQMAYHEQMIRFYHQQSKKQNGPQDENHNFNEDTNNQNYMQNSNQNFQANYPNMMQHQNGYQQNQFENFNGEQQYMEPTSYNAAINQNFDIPYGQNSYYCDNYNGYNANNGLSKSNDQGNVNNKFNQYEMPNCMGNTYNTKRNVNSNGEIEANLLNNPSDYNSCYQKNVHYPNAASNQFNW